MSKKKIKEIRRCGLGLWSDLGGESQTFSCAMMRDYPNCKGCPHLETAKIKWEKFLEEEKK